MKRNYAGLRLLLGTVAVGIGCSVFSGCDLFRNTDQEHMDSLQWCTLTFSDSLTVVESSAYQKMSIDLPIDVDTTSVDAGTKAAVEWIRKELISCSFPSWIGSQLKVAELPDFDLSRAGAENFVKACALQGLDSMAVELKEGAEDGFYCSYFNGLTIGLECQTDKYLTLVEAYEIYTGGAHGGYGIEGATFRRSDGQRMGWNLFNMDKREEIRTMLVHGVKSYFQENNEAEEITDKALFQEYLMLFDDPDTPQNELEEGLPFPGVEPYVTPSGINFVYQQYEIAAYAYGLPSFTLSFEDAAPLLSEEGRALIKP